MGMENQERRETDTEQKEIPASIQGVVQRAPNFDEVEYQNAARNELRLSREVSEDAFVKTLRVAVEKIGEGSSPRLDNLYGTLLNILERESMQDHPDRALFKQSIKDLADLDDHELRVEEGYWEDTE